MDSIFNDSTMQVLRRALDGLSLRQQVMSNNIANVDTPGFKAQDVIFEDALRQAIARGQGDNLLLMKTSPAHLDAGPTTVQPEVVSLDGAARADGNTVDIDYEMSRLAETQIAYDATARLVNMRLALLRSVVQGGGR